jgi:hypothetical protein
MQYITYHLRSCGICAGVLNTEGRGASSKASVCPQKDNLPQLHPPSSNATMPKQKRGTHQLNDCPRAFATFDDDKAHTLTSTPLFCLTVMFAAPMSPLAENLIPSLVTEIDTACQQFHIGNHQGASPTRVCLISARLTSMTNLPCFYDRSHVKTSQWFQQSSIKHH